MVLVSGSDLVCATVRNLCTVVAVAKVLIRKNLIVVEGDHVQFQSMVVGLIGANLAVVRPHVVQRSEDSNIDIEHVQTRNLTIMVNPVMEDRTIEENVTTISSVQWMVNGANGLLGVLARAGTVVDQMLSKNEHANVLVQNHNLKEPLVLKRNPGKLVIVHPILLATRLQRKLTR